MSGNKLNKLIGMNIFEARKYLIDEQLSVVYPHIRVVDNDDAITAEYRPNRLTIIIGKKSLIEKIIVG